LFCTVQRPTSYTESVETLFKHDSEWVAPVLWKSEFRNVLALYLRKQIITFEKVLLLQEEAELVMANSEFDISSSQVLTLVNESNCSSYDCEFIALAHHLNIPFITQDKKLLGEFPSTAISTAVYLSGLKP
jgi:predicted nucleic acid-binding protein